ncbi:MAG: energy-coupling factor transporter transmembrane component T [Anaerolineae bacterium]
MRRMSPVGMAHPVAWFIWIASAALATLLTRNPLYLVLLLGSFSLVIDGMRRSGAGSLRRSPLPFSPLRLAAFAIPVGALFNGLTSHVGETVLFRLPEALPLLGGAITAEAVVFGAINGLVLATLFAAFGVLNVAVPVRDLIGYLPRGFYPVAVVSAIAVTFVPSTQRQFQQVREAQAVRGHRMRGLGDWLPLFMPVLIGGLERALSLAEAMTARGFAAHRTGDRHGAVAAQIISVAGLVAVLAGGVLRLMPDLAVAAPFFLLGGVVAIGWAIWRAGRHVTITRYHQPRWSTLDSLTVFGALVALLPLLIWQMSRAYTPYPALTWPAFEVRVGTALLGYIVPVVGVALSNEAADDQV